jgi:hypothetical protein
LGSNLVTGVKTGDKDVVGLVEILAKAAEDHVKTSLVNLREQLDKLEAICGGVDSGKSWKVDLANDTSFAQLVEAAKTTLLACDVNDLDTKASNLKTAAFRIPIGRCMEVLLCLPSMPAAREHIADNVRHGAVKPCRVPHCRSGLRSALLAGMLSKITQASRQLWNPGSRIVCPRGQALRGRLGDQA